MNEDTNKPSITLEAWADQHFNPAPAIGTLRRWARAGKIVPAPVKVGRTYMVQPDAVYKQTTEMVATTTVVALPSQTVKLSPRAARIINNGQEAVSG